MRRLGLSSEPSLPTPPPEVDAYIKRTGHEFGIENTTADGYIVTERDRLGVVIATRVLGRFPAGCPSQFVIDAMRQLAGIAAA